MSPSKPVYLASDAHLGATRPAHASAFHEWLEFAAAEASEILLNGDVFDFWFEYRWGHTRGHDRTLHLLRTIVDSGVPIAWMGGNHDWWGGRILSEEVGVELLHAPVVRTIAGRRTLLAHGDGLGGGDPGYLVLKAVLRSPLTRFAFGMLPPRVGDRIAKGVSHTEERWDQWGPRQQARSAALERWALDRLSAEAELEMILLGHTHVPLVRGDDTGGWYVNSGDWVHHQSFVILDNGQPPRLLDWREHRV